MHFLICNVCFTFSHQGFLFLGEKLHKFNASMQYVAPLMADFGAHLNENAAIRYLDTGMEQSYSKYQVFSKNASNKFFIDHVV